MNWFSLSKKPPVNAVPVLTREQKMEMYARLLAAGNIQDKNLIDNLALEALEAIKAHDFDLALLAFKLAGNLLTNVQIKEIDFQTSSGNQFKETVVGRNCYFYSQAYFVYKCDYQALDFIYSLGVKNFEFEYDGISINVIDVGINDQKMLRYLLQHGAKPLRHHADHILENKLPAESFKLLLEYGLDVKEATDIFSKYVAENKLPVAYVSEIAELLKLPPAVKSVLPKPPEPKMPVEIAAQQAVVDPDIIVIERLFLQTHRICHEFNFRTLERTSAVRKDNFSPVESIETKNFSDLKDHPDLHEAFEQHVKRGGQRDEQVVFSRPAQTFKFTM